jgi:hypothetical protein
MKKITLLFCLSLLSLSAFSSEVVSCKAYGRTFSNVIVPSEITVESIDKAIKSNKTNEEKIRIISSLLYIDAVSLGDGDSFCELAFNNQGIPMAKCLKAMKTEDIIQQIIKDANEPEVENLKCRIGLELAVQLGFKM